MIQNPSYPFKNTIEHFYDYNLRQLGIDVATIATVGLIIAGPTGIKYGLWSGTLITLESDQGSMQHQ